MNSYHENCWEEIVPKNAPPICRSGHASCSFRDRFLFIFGGLTDKEALNDMYSYRIDENTWEKIEPSPGSLLPQVRASMTMVCQDDVGKIYLFGGTSSNPQNLCKNDLYEFDIELKLWRILKTRGTTLCDRYGHTMNLFKRVLLNCSDIIIFGGVKFTKNQNNSSVNTEFLNDLYIFSVYDKYWRKLNTTGAAPQPRYRHQGFIWESNLYIVGGSSNTNRFGNIHKFDFKSNIWYTINFEGATQKKDNSLFKGRFGHASLIDNGEIFIYGGTDDSIKGDILALDLKNKRWTRKKTKGSKPSMREFFSMSYCNRKMIIFGGRKDDKRLNDLNIWHISIPRASYKDCSLRIDMSNLYDSASENNFADVQLIIGTQENGSIFKLLHSCILKARSTYFYEMIKYLQGSDDTKIKLLCIDENKFMVDSIFKYIYSLEIDLKQYDNEKLLEMCRITGFSDLNVLFKRIISELLTRIDSDAELEKAEKYLFNLSKELAKKNSYHSQQNSAQLNKTLEWISVKLRSTYMDKEKLKDNLKSLDSLSQYFHYSYDQDQQTYYEDFEKIYLDLNTTDSIIKLGPTEFKIHRCLLIARCRFFEGVFSSGLKEKSLREFSFDTAICSSQGIFQDILKFLYSGFYGLKKLALDFANYIKFVEVCNYLIIKCANFNFLLEEKVSEFLNKDNCLEILDWADKINATIVKEKAMAFIHSNFKNIITSDRKDTLNNLPSSVLTDLLIYQASFAV